MQTHLPNALSISRFFLAFLLFSSSINVRLFALIAAAATDFFDGYLARKWNSVSSFGRTIDPVSDKFFVLIGLYIFFQEGALSINEAFLMLSRDAAIVVFMLFLMSIGRLKGYPINAIFCGKITTALQLGAFIALALGLPLPSFVFFSFGLLGVMALFELFYFYLVPRKV